MSQNKDQITQVCRRCLGQRFVCFCRDCGGQPAHHCKNRLRKEGSGTLCTKCAGTGKEIILPVIGTMYREDTERLSIVAARLSSLLTTNYEIETQRNGLRATALNRAEMPARLEKLREDMTALLEDFPKTLNPEDG